MTPAERSGLRSWLRQDYPDLGTWAGRSRTRGVNQPPAGSQASRSNMRSLASPPRYPNPAGPMRSAGAIVGTLGELGFEQVGLERLLFVGVCGCWLVPHDVRVAAGVRGLVESRACSNALALRP